MPPPAPDGTDRTTTRGTRVPPHDAGAERALLGALLLSRDAIAAAAPAVTADDLYTPAHAHIYEAITALAARGEPADPITVADELRSHGRLVERPADDHGDPTIHPCSPAGIVDLQGDAPGTLNAAHYARIVAGHARSRRLIAAAQQLADDAWTTLDPGEALTAARGRLAQLGDGLTDGSNLHVADVNAILDHGVVAPEADLLRRTDGRALFYAGHMHTLQAAPSTGKSWVALVAVAEVLAMGGAAVYLDWEDSPAGILGRLLALGVDPGALRTRFAYGRLDGSWGAAEHTGAHRLLDRLNPDLVVIDGVAEAMAHDGLDENQAPDFMGWSVRVPRPIAATGAAVVMLDHTKKDTDKTDRYSRGTGAKLAAVDGAAYLVTVVDPYSRHRAGRIALHVTKDRHGGVGAIGECAAHITIDPAGAGEVVRMSVEPPPVDTGPDGQWMPTRLMVRVSHLLSQRTMNPSAVVDALPHSKRGAVEAAIQALLDLGHITEQRGLGSAKQLRLVTAYLGPGVKPAPKPEPDPEDPLFDPDPPPAPVDLAAWKEENF